MNNNFNKRCYFVLVRQEFAQKLRIGLHHGNSYVTFIVFKHILPIVKKNLTTSVVGYRNRIMCERNYQTFPNKQNARLHIQSKLQAKTQVVIPNWKVRVKRKVQNWNLTNLLCFSMMWVSIINCRNNPFSYCLSYRCKQKSNQVCSVYITKLSRSAILQKQINDALPILQATSSLKARIQKPGHSQFKKRSCSFSFKICYAHLTFEKKGYLYASK